MPAPEQLLVFVVASVVLILTPGQDLYLVMTRSLGQGPKAGVVTAAGVSTGLLGHTLLVGLGLGAVIRASETLFLLLKVVGAAYLVWLGIQMLRNARADVETGGTAAAGNGRLYLQGALSNLSNPKIAVFYLAFLPQFVPAEAARPTLTLILLGAAFAALTFLIKAPIGWLAGRLAHLLTRRPKIQVWMSRFGGGVLIVLGVRLLTARASS